MKTTLRLGAILCVCVLMSGCASPTPQPLSLPVSSAPQGVPEFSYTFILERHETTPHLRISLALLGDSDGTTNLRIANSFGPLSDIQTFIEDVEVQSNDQSLDVVSVDQGHWQVVHEPGVPLVISWHVNTRGAEQTWVPRSIFYRPYLDHLGLHVFGVAVLLVPSGRESARGTMRWQGFDGWKVTSGAQIEPQERVSFTTFVRSTFLAGPELEVLERKLPGGILRVGSLGSFVFTTEEITDELHAIVEMQRNFFDDHSDPYVFVSILENGPWFDAHATQRNETGVNLLRSFAMMLRREATLTGPRAIHTHHLLMHETLHNWIGSRIYAVEGGSVQAAWFVEGFTHLLTWTMLKQSGLATPEQVDRAILRIAENYSKNPFKNAPNTISGPEFFKGPEGHDIAYNRGALIAAWFALRLVEHNTDLRSFLREMVTRSSEKPFNEESLRSFIAESTNDATAGVLFSFALKGQTIEDPLDILTTYFALIPEPK